MFLALALLLMACDGGATPQALVPMPYAAPGAEYLSACPVTAYGASTFTYAETVAVPVAPFEGYSGTVSFTIPEIHVAAGLVLDGSNSNDKFFDHGVLVGGTGYPFCITGPGGNAPLSFNQIDYDSPPDGVEDDPSGLINREAPGVFFPNDGSQLSLPAGGYSVPFWGTNANWSYLQSDTYQPYAYYKRPALTQSVFNINVFVASGVNGITTPAAAQVDAELVGAVNVLSNAYEVDADTTLVVNLTWTVVPVSYLTIDSQAEMDTLLRSYPATPTHDAVNLFIVGTIAIPGIPVGVVGISAGIPGPFARQGTVVSGVLAEAQGDGIGTTLGVTMAHELGHFLGLYHTSQTDPNATSIIGNDPISDTPVCTNIQMQQPGTYLNCPDVNNLMFPYVAQTPTPVVSPQQGVVVRLSPAVGITP